jgi:hypothetical protein
MRRRRVSFTDSASAQPRYPQRWHSLESPGREWTAIVRFAPQLRHSTVRFSTGKKIGICSKPRVPSNE